MHKLSLKNTADMSREALNALGKELRSKHPLEEHALIKPRPRGFSSIALLEKSNHDRLKDLIPIRYGRMLVSPFSFLRGSAALMADDLSRTPNSGIYVQACGDCHLLNFGAFATPERKLVFDINDFDETLPAPWEWDIKRLASSFVVAAEDNRYSSAIAKRIAKACIQSYREHLRAFSKQSPLENWYGHIDLDKMLLEAPNKTAKAYREKFIKKAEKQVAEYLFPKITTEINGDKRLIDNPPLMYHLDKDWLDGIGRPAIENYRASLSDDRKVLFDRYHLKDTVVKVVGIGSVGTRCFVTLSMTPDGEPLLLQIKEARTSVLEPYAGKSIYEKHGERVVVGQRLTQSSSDVFLGWIRGPKGRDFYVRQLRDMKVSMSVQGISVARLRRYAMLCGQTLAKSHAKSGNSALISGYLGKSDAFDEAVSDFSVEYAEQNKRDYAALVSAAQKGKITSA
jgi:uncharacterized protein (DUF2252 family)